jgi:YesN/AraC family two-component response regulator
MVRLTHALIVDDEAHVRTYLKLILRDLGFTECREAAEATTALAMVQAQPPELILLDVNMPGANGLELLHELSEFFPDVPVVIVTSQTLVGTVQKAAELGAAGYLAKFSPKEDIIRSLSDIIAALGDDPEETSDAGGI